MPALLLLLMIVYYKAFTAGEQVNRRNLLEI